jgi:uncharacterized membrane protein
MSRPAPRSIDEYLQQLRAALEGEDPALIQDSLYDSEEYLRAELAANTGKSEADVLELVAGTYGSPDEIATAYRETEVRVKAALNTPVRRPRAPDSSARARLFAVYSDPRAYTSLFFMLIAIVTGVVYFTFVVTGLSLSLGLGVLIIGLPFFLAFIGITRVMSLGEGRLLEAIIGVRMPRRPVHPGAPAGLIARSAEMLRDTRTWTTLAYFILMLPLGVLYFTIVVTGLSTGLALTAVPFLKLWSWLSDEPRWVGRLELWPHWLENPVGYVLCGLLGVLILTGLMHLVRGVGRVHGRMAKVLLVTPGT